MPHYVAFVEMHECQAVDPLQNIDGFDQTAAARVGQVDLRDVAGDHGFRAESEAGNETPPFLGRSVMRFVQGHLRIAERSCTHRFATSELKCSVFLKSVGT